MVVPDRPPAGCHAVPRGTGPPWLPPSAFWTAAAVCTATH